MDTSVFSDGDLSDFKPRKLPTKPKAPPKGATAAKSKTAAKQTTVKQSRPIAKKQQVDSSDGENHNLVLNDDDESLLSDRPAQSKKAVKASQQPKKTTTTKKPLRELDNDNEHSTMAKPKAAATGTSSERYQKLTQLEHILKRPDTYIGSIERTESEMWVFNSPTESMQSRQIGYVPGLYKIFDEILVNAADNRDRGMTEIKVWVNREEGEICVRNNGKGIPIEIHDKEGIYIPEMIFGHLLTGSNYNDDEKKVVGGRNGYGAKLCNIFSTEFSLETVDSKQQKKYKQTWRNNMGVMEKAKITSHKGDDYTLVKFKPDFHRFGMIEMDDNFEALVMRRVYDLAGTCSGIKVYLNDTRIKITKFKQYMEMYTKALDAIKLEGVAGEPAALPPAADSQVIVTDSPHPRWEVGFAVSDGAFQQVSFVNSIATTKGGTHVTYIADQIINRLADLMKKKNKGGAALKSAQIKNHLFLFVNCQIENPAFDSQSKESLTTKPSAFGSKCQLSDKFLKAIEKSGVLENIMDFAAKKADQMLKKSDGNRRARITHSKLTDANLAGSKDGHLCTLILTEGDSAAGLALTGRATMGADYFGVYPLRGKVLNVRDASIDQITKNQEIQNIKKFMGLQHKKEYTDTKTLRYGYLMIMTDQDHDGSHIKGLLINLFECQFPSLLRIKNFLQFFITPIVKVWKGSGTDDSKKKQFFNMPEYEAWKQLPGNNKGWRHKYYKGLGTNKNNEAVQYFSDLDRHLKSFATLKTEDNQLIDLVFSKKKADERKLWLERFVPGTYLNMSGMEAISYDDFVNKELILFSMADNQRSIPSVIDGFKPGQRKVLYTCLLRRDSQDEEKVVELQGRVSACTAYAYGDASLSQTIIGMAQDFVGSNNINVLMPQGNFGSRRQGGADHASARYIYTRLAPLSKQIFHPADEHLLEYHEDDGKKIEPVMYVPVIPMILVNGADGIGTGWSTSIPNYNPDDIIENLRRRLRGESKDDMQLLTPWFRGFTGPTETLDNGRRFKFGGIIHVDENKSDIEVTELPVRMWTQEFVERFKSLHDGVTAPPVIKDFAEYNEDLRVRSILRFDDAQFRKLAGKPGGFEELLRMSKSIATTNLVAFDRHGRIHRYDTILDIMEEFYHVRLDLYARRKAHQLSEMDKRLHKLTNQARFVKMIIDNKLIVYKKKKVVLIKELQDLGFKRILKVGKVGNKGDTGDAAEEDGGSAEDGDVNASDFDYLLGMAIWSLTQEKVDALLAQIGDTETEIDVLTKKSPKDLWSHDLDNVQQHWHELLDFHAAELRTSKRMTKNRRASAKLGIGAAKSKKRKADESDDYSDDGFGRAKKKTAGRPAPAKGQTAAQKLMSGYVDTTSTQQPVEMNENLIRNDMKSVGKTSSTVTKTASKSNPKIPSASAAPKVLVKGKTMNHADDVDSEIEVLSHATIKSASTKATTKANQPTTKAKRATESDEDDDLPDDPMDGLVSQSSKPAASEPPTRKGRAAAQKPKQYAIADEESDYNDDDLGNITNMVKGTVSTAPTRPLISSSSARPGAGLGARSSQSASTKATAIDIDDTDWEKLAEGSPKKPKAPTADAMVIDEDDDSLLLSTRKPVPAAKGISKAKPASKTGPAAKASKVSAMGASPKGVLSPAAKAYAARQVKAHAPASAAPVSKSSKSKHFENLSDDDEVRSASPTPNKSARPARKAVATKKSKYVVTDEDSDENDATEPSFSDGTGDDEGDESE